MILFDHYCWGYISVKDTLLLKNMLLFLDTASKHAIQSFSDTLRAEVAVDNIHVCVVNPGYIRTNLSHNAMCGDGSKYGGKV